MTDDAPDGRLTFGVNLGRLTTTSDPGPVAAARRAEADGFDIVSVADHVGSSGPFVLLGAAAAVTTRVRLRTYVLDYGFWNAGLLARDVATLDLLSGGRVEVGLGAGHMRHEHEAVGLPFPRYQERLAELDAFATRLRTALDDPGMVPRPVQSHVPLFLAAMSASGLALAARHGQFVALSGALQIPGRTPGTFTLASSAQTDARVGQVRAARAAAGLAAVGLDVLLQLVVVDRDPEQAAAELAAQEGEDATAAELLDSPFVLFASSPQEGAAELLRRSRRWGITSWCTHTPSGPALAQVMAALRARSLP
jgi:probable F420-dependent oxidoreductase